MAKLYISKKVQWFNNRPVQKVEVIKENGNEVTFQTDYPVDEITIPKKDFYENFAKR